MATSLFEKIIFGPIKSRRLGISLGVNLLDPHAKLCNFDCIYCECGWNGDHRGGHFNAPEDVIEQLTLALQEMQSQGELPSYITFAGNGEPTMHPRFEQIITQTISLRDRLAPRARIAVLTNATMIDRESVHCALEMVDQNILKFDSAILGTQQLLNRANSPRSIERQIELLGSFSGEFVIQTMFLRGVVDGQAIDNTQQAEVSAWLDALRQISPSQVMLYSIDRDTPLSGLVKVEREELEAIAEQVRELGLCATVS
ncbi:MAG: radical SAM protein [Rikenellaceae bacterium]